MRAFHKRRNARSMGFALRALSVGLSLALVTSLAPMPAMADELPILEGESEAIMPSMADELGPEDENEPLMTPSAFDEARAEATSSIDAMGLATQMETAIALHDWMVDRYTYDPGSDISDAISLADARIGNDRALCDMHSRLLEDAGIESSICQYSGSELAYVNAMEPSIFECDSVNYIQAKLDGRWANIDIARDALLAHMLASSTASARPFFDFSLGAPSSEKDATELSDELGLGKASYEGDDDLSAEESGSALMPYDAETVAQPNALAGSMEGLSATPSTDQCTVEVDAMGSPYDGASGVKFAIWSNASKQADLIWYDANKVSGGWSRIISVASHGNYGTYSVHVYGTVGAAFKFLGACSFSISQPKATVSVRQTPEQVAHGMFQILVDVDEDSCPAGANLLQAPTWSSANGQDDIVWYQLKGPEDDGGTWSIEVPCASDKRDPGQYVVHVYMRMNNGIYAFVTAGAFDVKSGPSNVDVSKSEDERTVEIRAYGGEFAKATSVQFPTWSDAGGQDDIVWYQASRNGANEWVASIRVADHRTAGRYTVHFYATIRGSFRAVGGSTFEISAPKATVEISQTEEQKARGVFLVCAKNLQSPSGATSVHAPTWSAANGQDDIVWYPMSKSDDAGKAWSVEVPCVSPTRDPGGYIAHVYVQSGNGLYGFAGATSGAAECSGDSIKASTSNDELTYTIEAYGPQYAKASSMSFPTWSSNGGQNDIIWYPATRKDGGWTCTVPISNHRDSGSYFVHAYGKYGSQDRFLGSTGFAVTAIGAKASFAQSADQKARGVFEISVSDVISPSGVSLVQVPTWSEAGGQDDIVWYTAIGRRASASSWTIEIPCASPVRDPGKYISHVYVTAQNGICACAATTIGTADIGPATLRATVNDQETEATIQAYGGDYPKASSVQFPTWSNAGGQDDIRWYTANRKDAGWELKVPIANHKTAGSYTVHAYGTIRGAQRAVGDTSFSITAPTAKATISDSGNGNYTVDVIDIASPSGVSKVQLPTWSASGGQDDVAWHDASDKGDGTWQGRIEAGEHGCEEGQYITHCYLTAKNGVQAFVGSMTRDVKCSNYVYVKGAMGSGQRTIFIKNPSSAGSVQMPTWSQTGGQDDIVWYNAVSLGSNLHRATIACSNLKHEGTVNCHIYAGGKMVASTTFTVNGDDIIPKWVIARAKLRLREDYRWSFDHGPKPASCQKYIVLHDTEGSGDAASVINWWDGNGQGVAAHFIVNRDGSIVQCVGLDRITHHAGYGNTGHNAYYGVTDESRDDKRGTVPIGSWARDYGMNSYSIGIEMVHVGGSGYYPEAQLQALDDLIAYIDAYYGFQSTIIDHKAWRSGNSDTSPEFAWYLRNYQTIRRHQ